MKRIMDIFPDSETAIICGLVLATPHILSIDISGSWIKVLAHLVIASVGCAISLVHYNRIKKQAGS